MMLEHARIEAARLKVNDAFHDQRHRRIGDAAGTRATILAHAEVAAVLDAAAACLRERERLRRERNRLAMLLAGHRHAMTTLDHTPARAVAIAAEVCAALDRDGVPYPAVAAALAAHDRAAQDNPERNDAGLGQGVG